MNKEAKSKCKNKKKQQSTTATKPLKTFLIISQVNKVRIQMRLNKKILKC